MTYKLRTSYLPEIKAALLGRNTPDTVSVNLTDQCSLSCIYCEIGARVPKPETRRLCFQDMQWIIDEMSELGIKRLALCGGEPFLFPGLIDLVAMAGKHKIICAITSNGVSVFKLDQRSLEILQQQNARINISIDSFDESTNALTRGNPSALGNSVKSLITLMNAGIPVKVLCVISKYNYKGLLEFVREAHQLGIPEVLFQPVISESNYPGTEKIKAKEQLNVGIQDVDTLLDQLRRIHEFERSHRIKTNVYRLKYWIKSYLGHKHNENGSFFFEEVLESFYCREVNAIVEISFDGQIQACGLIGSEVNIWEDREEGLLNLWHKATAGIRSDLSNKEYHTECNACCNHFSRNMIASAMRHPVANRVMLRRLGKLWLGRGFYGTIKKIKAG